MKISFIFILIIIIQSCRINNEKPERIAKLFIADTINFKTDKSTYIDHPRPDYFIINKSELVGYSDRERLLIYDLNKKEVFKTILLPKEGPNGIGKLGNAYFYNIDSIFIKNENPYSILLLNKNGFLIKKYEFSKRSSAALRGSYNNNNSKIILHNGYLIGFIHPDVLSKKSIFKCNAFFFHNISNNSTVDLKFLFPEKYWSNSDEWSFMHFLPSYVVNNHKLVVSFPAVDSLYVYNLKNNSLNRFPMRSEYQHTEISTLKLSDYSPKKESQLLKESIAYYQLFYDKYRKVYYRIVLLPISYNMFAPSSGEYVRRKPFSVQIINENFKLIGESLLPENTYNPVDIFVGKNGLYISNNNPENPEMDEDKLKYTLFTLNITSDE